MLSTTHRAAFILLLTPLVSCISCKTADKPAKAEPEPLNQTQLCMGTHAHIALSNSKYFDVIKLLDDKGKPIKCEVTDGKAVAKAGDEKKKKDDEKK